ncbi:amidohydrolase family protein [Myxococcus llanfairpwllgwyngyllgogerychwyrndrobwllllantysiliogogogochensis]|uniref:Amidohydrolase family protein n=1 Tax=Myxococcus llanfairpwllgwyngyllgogerychwyrndrobwllllantysiliogogogochensis TaxID=2590453 RepID=A0A540WQD5_9BACT|nr:amidohydrolase family protein [Myxococcus llanfairpwllgwyngyllgogerychwyrndrobwllllantysiliogogogochensis]TQF11223.1 amidohydrolase family protein [Myxococcus llanfairpwllgwyngyllgogerychwyrndrobwllllantysiliogogogochensis]
MFACARQAPDAVRGGERTSSVSVVVLKGARLIDGEGGPPIEDATLVIEGETIRAVGPSSDVAVPDSAQVIDVRGKSVLPGLVVNHAHLGVVDGTQSGSGHYTRDNVARQARQYEVYGVTTVTSLGFNTALFPSLQEEFNAGAPRGADLLGADRGLGVPSAAPPVNVGEDQLYRPRTPEEARAAVRETASRRPALVKIWVDDFHGTLPTKMAPDVYAAIIYEAHQQKLRVAAHVYYLEDAKRLVRDGVDILAHGVRDRPVDEELVREMKARGTWYVPTLGLDETFYIFAEQPEWMRTPFFEHSVQPALAAWFADPAWRAKALGDAKALAENKASVAMNLRNLKTLHADGVSIGFGSDSGATPLRIPGFAEHRELELMVQAGLTPLAALTHATRDAAVLLKLQDRGTLAAGKRADFILVEGNPAVDIRDVHRIAGVWHRGRRVSGGVEEFTP